MPKKADPKIEDARYSYLRLSLDATLGEHEQAKLYYQQTIETAGKVKAAL